ncbi:MAG TPA: hypothetical protein VE619_04045, partial [Nitrososphaeraceae archaeon]|nr:hypothetical protein [Nitrososphaeraceae archaeon]
PMEKFLKVMRSLLYVIQMCAHHEKHQESHGYGNLTVVALTILVMGVSLAAVILMWIWFGHIGPTFSSETLAQQQRNLRQQYGLPYKPIITDPKLLTTPPSLRNLTNGTGGSSNSSR